MNLDAKQKKFLLIAGAVVLGFYLVSKMINKSNKNLSDNSQSDSLDKTKLLYKGSQGAEVSELQRILIEDYNANLGNTGVNKDGIDGDFGLLTEVALKKAKNVTETTLNDL
jgi:hypothetical protein